VRRCQDEHFRPGVVQQGRRVRRDPSPATEELLQPGRVLEFEHASVTSSARIPSDLIGVDPLELACHEADSLHGDCPHLQHLDL
jgi:hypothetical protein